MKSAVLIAVVFGIAVATAISLLLISSYYWKRTGGFDRTYIIRDVKSAIVESLLQGYGDDETPVHVTVFELYADIRGRISSIQGGYNLHDNWHKENVQINLERLWELYGVIVNKKFDESKTGSDEDLVARFKGFAVIYPKDDISSSVLEGLEIRMRSLSGHQMTAPVTAPGLGVHIKQHTDVYRPSPESKPWPVEQADF